MMMLWLYILSCGGRCVVVVAVISHGHLVHRIRVIQGCICDGLIAAAMDISTIHFALGN